MSGGAVPPGVLGALAAGTPLEVATATLLDLAHRGHLTVTRTGDGWEVRAASATEDHSRAERVLLDVLGVDRGAAPHPCLTLDDADRVRDALVSDAARGGLVHPDPVRRRRQSLVLGAAVAVLALAGAVVVGTNGHGGLAALLAVLAVVVVLVGRRHPRVRATDAGRDAVRAGREVERRLVAGGGDVGPEHLATLTAVGRVQGLTRVLDRRNEPLPAWLHDADPEPPRPLCWLDVAGLVAEADPG